MSSLKEIAERTGVSISTVSRVLNDPQYQCQKKELTNLIRKTAQELKYCPNLYARKLQSQDRVGEQPNSLDSYQVDILLARSNSFEEDPFFAELYRYIEAELYRQNCIVGEILNVQKFSSFQIDRKMSKKAEGIIVLGKCPENIIAPVLRGYQAAIAVDRNPMDYKMDEVTCNGASAARMAVEYLIELGHNKISYVGDCSMEARYIGYYESILSHKIPLNYEYIVSTNQTKEEGYHAFQKIIESKNLPTAVFCANDVTALGFLQAMTEYNGRRKKNVYKPAVIAIDDIEEASHIRPMLSTVRIPKSDMAHLAVILLRDRLISGHQENIRLELPCHLCIRESTGFYVG